MLGSTDSTAACIDTPSCHGRTTVIYWHNCASSGSGTLCFTRILMLVFLALPVLVVVVVPEFRFMPLLMTLSLACASITFCPHHPLSVLLERPLSAASPGSASASAEPKLPGSRGLDSKCIVWGIEDRRKVRYWLQDVGGLHIVQLIRHGIGSKIAADQQRETSIHPLNRILSVLT